MLNYRPGPTGCTNEPVQHTGTGPVQPVLLEALAVVALEDLRGIKIVNALHLMSTLHFVACTLNMLMMYAVLAVCVFLKWPASVWASTSGGRQMAATSLYRSSVWAAEYLDVVKNKTYIEVNVTFKETLFKPTASSSARTWSATSCASCCRTGSDPFAPRSARSTR